MSHISSCCVLRNILRSCSWKNRLVQRNAGCCRECHNNVAAMERASDAENTKGLHADSVVLQSQHGTPRKAFQEHNHTPGKRHTGGSCTNTLEGHASLAQQLRPVMKICCKGSPQGAVQGFSAVRGLLRWLVRTPGGRLAEQRLAQLWRCDPSAPRHFDHWGGPYPALCMTSPPGATQHATMSV